MVFSMEDERMERRLMTRKVESGYADVEEGRAFEDHDMLAQVVVNRDYSAVCRHIVHATWAVTSIEIIVLFIDTSSM